MIQRRKPNEKASIRGAACGIFSRKGGRADLLLPDRRRRAAYQGRRQSRRRVPEGTSGRQDQRRLRRQLRRRAHQGARGAQGRAAGADVGAVLDRPLRAARAGRDPAVRRRRRHPRGQSMAEIVLPGADGERHLQGQGVRHPVPALDHRHVLEQGGVQGSRARPGEAAGHLERDGADGAEAGEEGRLGQRVALGRDGPVYRLRVLDVPGVRARERPGSHEQGRQPDQLRACGRGRRAAILG